MKHRSLSLLSALAATIACVATLGADDKVDLDRRTPVPADQPIPLADFLRPAFLSNPKINPAGTHVAAVMTAGEDKNRLIVYELATMKGEAYDPPGDTSIYDVTWLGDKRLAFEIGFYKAFIVGLYASEIGRMRDPYPLLQYAAARLIAVPPARRDLPLAWIPPGSSDAGRDGQVCVVKTDVKTGKMVNMLSVSTSSGDTDLVYEDNRKHMADLILGPTEDYDAGFMADKDGNLAFGFTSAGGRFAMHRLVGGKWEKTPVNLDEVDVLGFGRTRDEIVVRGPRQEGRPRALQFMDATTGKPGDVLVQDEKYDFFGSLYHEPATNNILGANFSRNGPAMAWFSEDYVGLQKFLESSFPGVVVRVVGGDDPGRMLIVQTYSDRQPVSYFWVDLEKRSVGPIEKTLPWIDPERMRPTSIIAYKTRDGQRLDAYVTLPAGASKTNPVPLIVLPPGQSQTSRSSYEVDRDRANWGYHFEAQLWASRGYAVLRPNHRGSAGYGWMFPESDQWELTKMADDVAVATRYFLNAGVIDPKRIAISGYGSAAYFAVAAAQADPDLFRAVIANQGTYNWVDHVRSMKTAGVTEVNLGVIGRHIGDDARLRELSLNGRVDRLRAAVFVGYQRELGDLTKQSTDLLSDLGRAGVAHEAAPIGSSRSSLNFVRNQVELYSRVEAFLAKHLAKSP